MVRGIKTKELWKKPEYRKHMSDIHKGHIHSNEQKRNISKSLKGHKGYWTGKKRTFTGKKHSEETKKKISLTLINNYIQENHYNWQGGKSKEEYGFEFNNFLKEKIRERDEYKCKICGIKQRDLIDSNNKKYSLIIHHINFNKKDNNINNLISLCRRCHIRLHNGKKYNFNWT